MNTFYINRSDLLGHWETPPENAGQIVDVSYNTTERYILEKIYDRSDRSLEIVAYRFPAGNAEFEPQNEAPKLGRRIANVVIIEDP